MSSTYPPAGAGSIGQILSAAAAGSPPGLWQPPGFGGMGGGGGPPPLSAGQSATSASAAGNGLGAVGEARGSSDLQKEISSAIEAKVSGLIEEARLDTESKVKMELKSIRDAMMGLDRRLDEMISQLEGVGQQEPAETPLSAETVGQFLSKIEQQWGQEIRTLKQELHQMILAHNHNADLIKHHKDTIDALRERCVKLQGNSVKTSEIQQQLQHLDARLKQQQKQRKLEPLFERLAVLEQRVTAAQSAAWRGYPGMPPVVPPGMSVPPGIPPAMMPGMGAAAAGMMAAAKSAGAKGGGATGAAAAAAAAAGAAVPGTKMQRAAYKCPADDEVQACLSKLSVGADVMSKSDFATEMPVVGLATVGDGASAQAEEIS